MKPNYSLTKSEREFAIKFMESQNMEMAYRYAYSKSVSSRNLSNNSVKTAAARLLQKDEIVEFIKDVRQELAGTVLYDLKALVIDLVQIVQADPNEISQIRRECCRYCYGEAHHWHWAEWEYYEAMDAYERDLQRHEENPVRTAKPEIPDDVGGFGWDPHRLPHPQCPRCYGDGRLSTWLADSRTLSPAARKLYAGAKIDKNGNIEAIMHNQAEARSMLTRIFGAWNPVKTASGNQIRDAADKVADENSIVINLINSPDA